MTNYLTNSFQTQTTDIVRMAVQQKLAKIAPTFTVSSFKGEGAQVADYLQTSPAPQKNRASKSDTVYSDVDTLRRWIYPDSYTDAKLIDQRDKLYTLNDPSNMYTNAISAAMARQKDSVCVGAFFADAKTGKTGTGTATFPGTQLVGVTVGGGGANVGLNTEKLLAGLEILRGNEVDLDFEEIYCPITSTQERNLRNEIRLINKDYGSVFDQTTGKLMKWSGINFIHSERLETDGSGYRRVPLYVKSGMQLGIWKDIEVTITDKVPTKNNNGQIFAEMTIGATRTEEEKVVEMKCAE